MLTRPKKKKVQAFANLAAILKAAGSDLQNVVKVTVFLTTMENYAAMNKVYDVVFEDPKPVSFYALCHIGLLS